MNYNHITVLLNKSVEMLNIKSDGVYVDCTLGGAGHSLKILEGLGPKGKLISIDKDQRAIDNALKKVGTSQNIVFEKSDFSNIKSILLKNKIMKVDGILIDLGVSSHQIDCSERGFSYMQECELDMRMDQDAALSASDVLNEYSQQDIANVLKKFGEEPKSYLIASRIIERRQEKPIKTSSQLNEVIYSVYGKGKNSIKAMKRVYQALRIEVNCEMDSLSTILDKFDDLLNIGGRMAVITFHSMEDRMVKQAFKKKTIDCVCPPNFPKCVCDVNATIKLIKRKPYLPDAQELKDNKRSISAKLRVCERI